MHVLFSLFLCSTAGRGKGYSESYLRDLVELVLPALEVCTYVHYMNTSSPSEQILCTIGCGVVYLWGYLFRGCEAEKFITPLADCTAPISN